MECVTAIDNIVAFVQGEADETLRREIAMHIRNCPRCRREANEVRRTLEVMRDAGEDFTPSSRVWMQLMARIKAIRAGLDDGVAGGAADTVEPYDRDDASIPGQMSPAIALTRGRKIMAIAICGAVVVLLAGLVVTWRMNSRFALKYLGDAAVYNSDNEIVLKGEKFFVGDSIRVTGATTLKAKVVYPSETKLFLSAAAKAQFESESVVYLAAGSMQVLESGKGKIFTVRTDYGSIVAKSAADFEVVVDKTANKTTLLVKTGPVDFTNAGNTEIVEAGDRYEALAGMTPRIIETVPVVSAVALKMNHNYVVGLAVYDPKRKEFVDTEMDQTVVLVVGSKARLRFRVTNAEDFEILFPRGNARLNEYDTASIRSVQDQNLRLPVRSPYFDATKELPRPGSNNKIKLGSNEHYDFYCEIPLKDMGLKPGKTIEIYGRYGVFLASKKTNRIKISLAALPPKGEGGPEE